MFLFSHCVILQVKNMLVVGVVGERKTHVGIFQRFFFAFFFWGVRRHLELLEGADTMFYMWKVILPSFD